MSMERSYRTPGAADLAGEAREGLCVEEAAADVDGDAAEDLRLLRRYEPVLRFTRGELFLPMSVSAYLDRCGLWQAPESGRSRRRRAAAVRLCAPGEHRVCGTCHCVSSSALCLAVNTVRGGASRGERGWRQAAAGSPSSACWVG